MSSNAMMISNHQKLQKSISHFNPLELGKNILLYKFTNRKHVNMHQEMCVKTTMQFI